MTDAEQVACDALRMAGIGAVADNLEFAREAVKVKASITNALAMRWGDGCCEGCGVYSATQAHLPGCRFAALFASDPAWTRKQINLAHAEALHTSTHGEPGTLFGPVPTLNELRAAWGLNDVVTGAGLVGRK